MAEADPWAGMVNPRAALAAAKQAAGALARDPVNSSQSSKSENIDKSKAYDVFSHSSHSSRGGQKLSPASHSAAKDRKETCSSSLSMTWPDQEAPGQPDEPDHMILGDITPAKPAKWLACGLSHSNARKITLAIHGESFSDSNEVPSPTAHLTGPPEWIAGVALLDRWQPPCPGFRSDEWEFIGRTIQRFMEQYAEVAAARGWVAIDLFGVHPRVGAARVDCCGALMVPASSTVTAISSNEMTFGPVVYRKRPMPDSVLAWAFGRPMSDRIHHRGEENIDA